MGLSHTVSKIYDDFSHPSGILLPRWIGYRRWASGN